MNPDNKWLPAAMIGTAIAIVAFVGHRWMVAVPKTPVAVEQTAPAAQECPKPIVKKRHK